MHPTELLIRLIRRTLILTIDVKTAEAAGGPFAIAYQRPLRARQREAAEGVVEIREGNPDRGRRCAPDAYARAAAASNKMRTALEPASA